MSAITDKPVEDSEEARWEDMKTKRMQDAVKDREVLTPPRKKVREEEEEINQKVSEKHGPRSTRR